MMRSRGFTLLEILVALGVLGVVLGLSLPAVSSRLDRGSFDANSERLVGALRLARDEARHAGRPVSVRATTRAIGRAMGPTTIEWSFQTETVSEEDATSETEWTALVEIPRGNALTDQDPASLASDGSGGQPTSILDESAFGPEFDESGVSTISLCVFMPSAEAVVSGPIWLVDAEGDALLDAERWVRLTISPWTGRITSERGTRAQLADSAAPEPDESNELIDAWETGPEVAP